jgi:hypothetical protein
MSKFLVVKYRTEFTERLYPPTYFDLGAGGEETSEEHVLYVFGSQKNKMSSTYRPYSFPDHERPKSEMPLPGTVCKKGTKGESTLNAPCSAAQ